MDMSLPRNVLTCWFCNGELSIFKKQLFDTRYGVDGSYNIYQCGSCSLIQIAPRLTEDLLKNIYEIYYNYGEEKKGTYSAIRRLFLVSMLYRIWMMLDGDICFHSNRGSGRLIDIGSNEGRGLQIYSQNGYSVEGFEINEKAANVAREKGLLVHTGNFDAFTPHKPYDIAVLSHVLEHIDNPDSMISNISRILKPDGQLWISCPNIKSWQRNIFSSYWAGWHVPFHITFYSEVTIKRLLKKHGFENIKTSYVSPGLWMAQSTIAAIFAKKCKKNLALCSSVILGFLMLFARFFFFPLLWVGNLTAYGDCLVIEAKRAGFN